MKYNKGIIHNLVRSTLKQLVNNKGGYYIYPKFRVMRDLCIKKCYQKYGNDAIFVNLGAGEYFYHPRWKNYDLYEPALESGISHFNNYDLRGVDNIEFPESDVQIIYCSHTLEHIPEKNIRQTLKRIFRSLKVGGVFRVIVPDAKLILNAYDNKDFEFFMPYESWFRKRNAKKIYLEDYLLQLLATPKCRIYNEELRHADSLNGEEVKQKRRCLNDKEFLDYLREGLEGNNIYGTDYFNWFDSEKLMSLLKDAGFSDVYRSAFGQSKELVMRQVPLFDKTLPYLSLYVEAVK
ncbi:MAG: methyltransferase domain-containing protein [Candidatus Sedimenticola sp. (ex Thyasira tokunagai)]